MAPQDDERPVVRAEESLPELTFKALFLGVLLAAVLGSANAYLGFKAGQTVSATFPAAVLAIAAFRLRFLRGSILEQNTMRTAATVGEALVAGAIFTIPAFVMVNVDGERLWTGFNYWGTSFILLVGGVLGILFIILLRRTLAVDAGLPFPESRACAQIVKAGQQGDAGARFVFGALGIGMLIQVLKDSAGLQLFRESIDLVWRFPSSVIHHLTAQRESLGDVAHGGAFSISTPSISPALIGVGYIIGFRLAAVNFAGGLLAWLVFVPLALFLNPELSARLGGASGPVQLDVVVFSIWYNQIRPIAVGAMLVGATWTMWGLRSSLREAFRGALRRGSASEATRIERDIPSRWVLGGILALSVPMTFIYFHFSGSVVGAVVAAVVMLVTGFLFSAVGGYLVGLVGGSNQPVSGLALSTLIIAALLMVGFGVTGLSGVGAVLAVAAVVCCACCVSGSLIQDLKIGRILGATPWKMEVAEIVSTVVTAFILVIPIVILHQGNIAGGGIGIGDPALPAPQAGLMAQLAQGIVGGEMPWALILFGMAFSVALVLLRSPSPMLVAVGMYLPFETTGAIFLGGCLKALADWMARRASFDPARAERHEGTGTLVASGLIAGESLTGVALAGFALASDRVAWLGGARSLTELFWGVETLSFVPEFGGALLSLLPLSAIVIILVAIPLRDARRARTES